jgi:hypothetical protein
MGKMIESGAGATIFERPETRKGTGTGSATLVCELKPRYRERIVQ